MAINIIKHIILVFCRKIRHFPTVIPYKPMGKFQVAHISAFSYGNAGDTLLPVVLRDLFNICLGVRKWNSYHVHNQVTQSSLKTLNENDFIVIGGGGLFLKDTNPNNNSGWQWNCNIENLNKINVPIISFAIGYNRFRNQEDFEPIFKKHINHFVKKSFFLGIRNKGSIEKLKGYLDSEELKEKLVFQPCMTTIISKIYPSSFNYHNKSNVVAFNCAFDRSELRGINSEILQGLAKTAKKLSSDYHIFYYSHMESDRQLLPYFDLYKVKYKVVDLNSPRQIIKAYTLPKLVIGMRGHSQMIPFGCSTPILSIISHDKMKWFLDDINHPEWGVDIIEDEFESLLMMKAISILDNYKECIDIIEKEKEILWKITLNNMDKIKVGLNNFCS